VNITPGATGTPAAVSSPRCWLEGSTGPDRGAVPGRSALPVARRTEDDLLVRSEEVMAVRASIGDRIIIKGHRIGEPDRNCEVLEVRGQDGGPPYVVRWGENGHETLFFPGPDATVQHSEHASG
jgi:hypothetical protein